MERTKGPGGLTHNQDPHSKNATETKIIECLTQQKTPKNAAQITRHIGNCDKKAVNRILYRLKSKGDIQLVKMQGSKPMWSIGSPGQNVHRQGGRGGTRRPGQRKADDWTGGNTNPNRHQHNAEQDKYKYANQHPNFPHSVSQYQHMGQFPGGGYHNDSRGGSHGMPRGDFHHRPQKGPHNFRGGSSQHFHKGGLQHFRRGGPHSHNVPRGGPQTTHRGRGYNGPRGHPNNAIGRAKVLYGDNSHPSNRGNHQQGPIGRGSRMSLPPKQEGSQGVKSHQAHTPGFSPTKKRQKMSTGEISTHGNGAEKSSDQTMSVETSQSCERGAENIDYEMHITETDTFLEDSDVEEDVDMEEDARFQDMMGGSIYTGDDFWEDDMGMSCSWTDLILVKISLADKKTMTVTQLAELLGMTEEETSSDLETCGDKVVVSNGVCSLTKSGEDCARETLLANPSLAEETYKQDMTQDVGSASLDACFPSGPPMPPKEWLACHQDQGADIRPSPSSTAQPLAKHNVVDGALSDLMKGRGRGLATLLGAKSEPVPPGCKPSSNQSSLSTISPLSSAVPSKTLSPPNDNSDNQTNTFFQKLDSLQWTSLSSVVSENKPTSESMSLKFNSTPDLVHLTSSATSAKLPLSSSQLSSSSSVLQSSNPAEMVVRKSVSGGQSGWMSSASVGTLNPQLQRFAEEGLTFVPSVSRGTIAGNNGLGTSPAFHKPPTPIEIIERQMGKTGLSPFNTAGPSSLSTQPSHNTSQPSGSGSMSLPAMRTMETAGAGGLQITSESFAALNKNPISALMEYAQSRHMTATINLVSQRGPSHRPVFVMAATVGNRRFATITCHNKKDGKTEAACAALKTLIAEGQLSVNAPSPVVGIAPENMTHFDNIAALTHQTFNMLIASIPENLAGRKVIAGLVMKRSADDVGIVISMGSGNRCITGDKLSMEGNTVNDSHAEIITRRGFLRFLYQQFENYEPGKPHDLLEPGSSGKLKVKAGVTFHLYISTAPCGDGALFSPRDAESNSGVLPDADRRDHRPTFTSAVQGLLRTKMEGGEGTIPVDTKNLTMQTWDGVVRGERLRTMSCTDKICRWNLVGMQGALLSHFLEPVYMDSLTLGFLYDHGHLSRAVCCRLAHGDAEVDKKLPAGFHLNHPWLGRVTACQPLRETQKTKAYSINWVLGDTKPEVLDGTLGHCYTAVEKKLFSRLSKRSMYDSFQRVAKHMGRSDLCQTGSYRNAKIAAKDFQSAKSTMLNTFQQLGCGWVKKPVEEEMFS